MSSQCNPVGLAPLRIAAPANFTTLEAAKDFCRVDWIDDDETITKMIKAAEARLDGPSGIIGQALLGQTWRQDFLSFGSGLRLRIEPVMSVLSLTYYDVANLQNTLPDTQYVHLVDELGHFVEASSSFSWPSSYRRRDSISITVRAGFGEDAEDVPYPIQQAVLELVAYWFQNREAAGRIPDSVAELVFPFKTFFVA